MKIRNLMLMLLLFLNASIYAQKNNGLIIIKGELDSSTLLSVNKNPSLWFYDFYKEKIQQPLANKIDLKIEGLKFEARFKPKENSGYFIFNGHLIRSIFKNVCFVERGDSVTIHLKSNGHIIYFTGKGADKVNYQAQVARHLMGNLGRFKSPNDPLRIAFYKKKRDSLINLCLNLLESNRKKWSKEVHEILLLNTIGAINGQYINSLLNAKKFNDQEYLSLVEAELVGMLVKKLPEVQNGISPSKYTFLYTKYLFDLNAELIALQTGNKLAFNVIYDKIKRQYSGRLREELIFHAFLSVFKDFNNKDNLLSDILSFITDEDYIALIKGKMKSGLSGAPAFNFDFMGYKGGRVKLDDFKGKVVVLDTWFTGCASCAGLTKYMEPIIKHFKDQKNVVFLGINVDKDKEKFATGVKSGLYGSKETIYAYTNGLGKEHPMLLHYQYTGYPNLLLIDKYGKIISTAPPRPFSNQEKEHFIRLIEEHL